MPFSLVGPNISLKTFLSKTISLLVIVSFSVHVSHAYVTTGLITEQYNFNFAISYITWRYKVLKSQGLPVPDTDILNYFAKNTLPPHYKDQMVDAVLGNHCYLFSELPESLKYILTVKCRVCKATGSGTHSYHCALKG